MNLADALERIRGYVRKIETQLEPPAPPTPEQIAEKQRQHEKAARERLFRKRHHAQIKADRQFG